MISQTVYSNLNEWLQSEYGYQNTEECSNHASLNCSTDFWKRIRTTPIESSVVFYVICLSSTVQTVPSCDYRFCLNTFSKYEFREIAKRSYFVIYPSLFLKIF
jgi:hypothetical protein